MLTCKAPHLFCGKSPKTAWEVKPEKEQALLGLVKPGLSRWLFTVNGSMARAEMDKAEWESSEKRGSSRVQGHGVRLDQTGFRLCPRDCGSEPGSDSLNFWFLFVKRGCETLMKANKILQPMNNIGLAKNFTQGAYGKTQVTFLANPI